VIGPDRPIATDTEGCVQEELVRQAQQGDVEAFDSLARMVGDRCLAIAVRITTGTVVYCTDTKSAAAGSIDPHRTRCYPSSACVPGG
jgi:hypothetical protein